MDDTTMLGKFMIRLIEPARGGWSWTLAPGEDSIYGDEEEFRTAPNGEGLWHYARTGNTIVNHDGSHEPEYQYKQVLGTTQFSLRGNRHAAYLKIRRFAARGFFDGYFRVADAE